MYKLLQTSSFCETGLDIKTEFLKEFSVSSSSWEKFVLYYLYNQISINVCVCHVVVKDAELVHSVLRRVDRRSPVCYGSVQAAERGGLL